MLILSYRNCQKINAIVNNWLWKIAGVLINILGFTASGFSVVASGLSGIGVGSTGAIA